MHLIVGFAAGSTTDILARLMAPWLSERLGQQFVVESRPGRLSPPILVKNRYASRTRSIEGPRSQLDEIGLLRVDNQVISIPISLNFASDIRSTAETEPKSAESS